MSTKRYPIINDPVGMHAGCCYVDLFVYNWLEWNAWHRPCLRRRLDADRNS